MNEKKYDVVIIGAGNGGLSAAMYLLKHNKKVLLLEKNNIPGGCATSVYRGRFEFEMSLHELCQMGDGKNAGTVKKLLDEYGIDVEWVPINESFRSINTDKDIGFDVKMPVGVEAFIDEMEKNVPGSRSSMETVMELGRMIADGVDWLYAHDNEPQNIAKIEMLLKYKDLMKIVPISTDEMLRKIGVPDKAREIYESYWDYIAADSTNMSFAVYTFMVWTYLTKKPYIAKNRSTEIALAFDSKIRELGGKIRYNVNVSKIDIKDGKVCGVITGHNEYIACDRVISNVMPNVVFDKMVDKNEVPMRDKKLINARKLGQSAFTIYLGLDISYEELGFYAYDTFIRSTGDTHLQYENAATVGTHKDYCVTVLNEIIPDCTEKGTCMIQFSKFYTEDILENITEEEYFKLKDKIAEETITHFENIIGKKIREHIEEIVVATNSTWARYIGTPKGCVYGYEPMTWDGMFPRVEAGHKLDYTIKGLRFCGGHGTQMDGYSQSYLSGVEQAKYTMMDMQNGT